MPPRALASALAMVLEDWGIFTVGDFADFLDGIDGIEGAANVCANRIRSDELAAGGASDCGCRCDERGVRVC